MFAGNADHIAKSVSVAICTFFFFVAGFLSWMSGSILPLLLGFGMLVAACLIWLCAGLIVIGPVWILAVLKQLFVRHAH